MEKYFESRSKLVEFLIQEMKFEEDDAEDCLDELVEQEEESYKRSTRYSGYILNSQTGHYYSLVFTSDYDWGSSDFYLDTTPLEMKEEIQTITVKKFVPIKEEMNNDQPN